jgi:hypothetical protein
LPALMEERGSISSDPVMSSSMSSMESAIHGPTSNSSPQHHGLDSLPKHELDPSTADFETAELSAEDAAVSLSPESEFKSEVESGNAVNQLYSVASSKHVYQASTGTCR